MKIADPLIFMVYPWVNFKSSDNGQGIEYLLKKVRISGKFNVSLTPCVMPCPGPGLWSLVLGPFGPDLGPDLDLTWDLDLDLSLTIGFEQILNHRSFRYCSVTYNVTKGMVHYKKSKNMMAISIKGWGVRSIPSCFYFFLYGF